MFSYDALRNTLPSSDCPTHWKKKKKKKKKNKPNTQTNKKISSFKAGKAIIVDGVHPLKKRSFQGLHFSTKVRNLKCLSLMHPKRCWNLHPLSSSGVSQVRLQLLKKLLFYQLRNRKCLGNCGPLEVWSPLLCHIDEKCSILFLCMCQGIHYNLEFCFQFPWSHKTLWFYVVKKKS